MLFVSDIFMTPPIGVRDADSMIAMFLGKSVRPHWGCHEVTGVNY